jgi:GMP synthase-like glutamine amidotransferase
VTIVVVHHLERPFLGHAGPALRAAGAELREVFRRDGDALPDVEAGVDGIILFGGEQSAVRLGEDPMLAAEAAWLGEALARDVPVLGVCLGAQLLAAAAGAPVRRLAHRRLDWAPLRPTAAAREDPLFRSVPADAHGVFWNEDGFDLPPGAVALATPSGGSCAAFRLGDAAWGVQFHPELSAAELDDWYVRWGALLDAADVTAADARAADDRHLPAQEALSAAIFGGFARACAARSRSAHGS